MELSVKYSGVGEWAGDGKEFDLSAWRWPGAHIQINKGISPEDQSSSDQFSLRITYSMITTSFCWIEQKVCDLIAWAKNKCTLYQHFSDSDPQQHDTMFQKNSASALQNHHNVLLFLSEVNKTNAKLHCTSRGHYRAQYTLCKINILLY